MSRRSKARVRCLKILAALFGLSIVMLLPTGVLASGGGWTAPSSGSTHDLAYIAVGDAGRAWAVGAGGTILVSADGGLTWTLQTSGTTSALHGVAFPDDTNGWVVGDGGTILHTTDAGVTWTAQTSNTTQNLRAVTFVGALHGWAAGDGGTILATDDGGTTWVAQSSTTTVALSGVRFADTSSGWAVGEGGTIVRTSDAGSTWGAQVSGTTQNLTALAVTGAGSACSVGENGTVLTTADGGVTWSVRSPPATSGLRGVAFADATHGWAVGDGGTILRTTDGGILDTTAPVASATGLRSSSTSGWRNTAQTVTLRASDADSGVAAIYYRLDGQARQTYLSPFSVSAAGSHHVTYWSVDWAGNVGARHTGYVNIDVGRPVCLVLRNASSRPGLTVKLAYRVNDPKPTCGKASVTITFFRSSTAVKRLKIASVPVNSDRVYAYAVGLRPGKYTWVVAATDLAGNAQASKDSGRLSVVAWPLPTTADVQRCLVALRYLPAGAVTGVNDYRTQQAVMAFQAWSGLTRDGIAGQQTRLRLANASPPVPRREAVVGRYAEVFRSLGVLLLVENGSLVRAVHCSTGRPGLATPAGRFAVYMKSTNWYSTEYNSWMPYSSFFTAGYAIHSYPDVPAYPASHGCVRVSAPEAPWVYSFLTYGTPVFVY